MRISNKTILSIIITSTTLSGCSGFKFFNKSHNKYAPSHYGSTHTPDQNSVSGQDTLGRTAPPTPVDCNEDSNDTDKFIVICQPVSIRPEAFTDLTGTRGYNAYGTTNYASSPSLAHHQKGANELRGSSSLNDNVKTDRFGDVVQPNKQKGLYASVGGVIYDTSTNAHGVQARIGYKVTPYIGIELEGSTGIHADDINGQALDVKYQAGAFGIGQFPITKNLHGIVRGGYHMTEFDPVSAPLITDLETDGFAYGLGLEYHFSPKNSLRVDYTRYEMKSLNDDNNAAAIAYVHKF